MVSHWSHQMDFEQKGLWGGGGVGGVDALQTSSLYKFLCESEAHDTSLNGHSYMCVPGGDDDSVLFSLFVFRTTIGT